MQGPVCCRRRLRRGAGGAHPVRRRRPARRRHARRHPRPARDRREHRGVRRRRRRRPAAPVLPPHPRGARGAHRGDRAPAHPGRAGRAPAARPAPPRREDDLVSGDVARSVSRRLRAHPRRRRLVRADEVTALLADPAPTGARRLDVRSGLGLLRGGWATRWREHPPMVPWLASAVLDRRLPPRYRECALRRRPDDGIPRRTKSPPSPAGSPVICQPCHVLVRWLRARTSWWSLHPRMRTLCATCIPCCSRQPSVR